MMGRIEPEVTKMFSKIQITGTMEVVTGMHIGGSSAFAAIGAVDSPVIKDSIDVIKEIILFAIILHYFKFLVIDPTKVHKIGISCTTYPDLLRFFKDYCPTSSSNFTTSDTC